jgi:hypothetical protein
MKTNHPRGFRASTHRDKGGSTFGAKLPLSGEGVFVLVTHSFCNGNRGMAKAVRGAKKFVRSRARFHENRAAQRLAREH